MSTRFSRKNIDINYKGCGSLTDIYDDHMKSLWRINDEQYDFICEYGSDEELDLFVSELNTIESKRKALRVVNELVEKYYKTKT